MYLLDGPPFTRKEDENVVVDGYGNEVRLFPGTEEVLAEIVQSEQYAAGAIQIGYASRTNYPEWALECLSKLSCPGAPERSLLEIASFKEIYPGDKKTHFRRFHEKSKVDLEHMIFFDNERRNCTSVSQLGVQCVYTPDGMTYAAWVRGLERFN